jgi:hypothetical protein
VVVCLWNHHHQILGPRRHLPQFADCFRGHSDIRVCIDAHLSWQATNGDLQRWDAFGFESHKGPPLFVQVSVTHSGAALAMNSRRLMIELATKTAICRCGKAESFENTGF